MKPDTPAAPAQNTVRRAPPTARAKSVLACYFFIAGALLPVWASRIPAVKEQSGVGAQELGIALLGLGVAAMVAARAGGGLLDKLGIRYATAPAAVFASAALILPGTATGPFHLAMSLAALGACQSFLNVCVNTQAAHLQQAAGRSMLSTFHAFVSIGGCAGALAGVASAHLGLAPLLTFKIVAAALSLTALCLARTLLRSMPRRVARAAPPEGPRMRPSTSPTVLLLGGLALAGVLTESAVQDWSALFAAESVGAGETMAATVFAVFTVAMAGGRLVGDRLARLLGRVLLVRAGATLALAGFVLALGVQLPVATLAGFALVGLGMSCVLPQILSAVSDLDPARVARNIGTVVSIGYIGPLIGSPTIGAIASHTDVATGLYLPAGLTLLLVLGGGRLRTGPRHGRRTGARESRLRRRLGRALRPRGRHGGSRGRAKNNSTSRQTSR